MRVCAYVRDADATMSSARIQAGQRRVEAELGNESRAAPIRHQTGRIDRRDGTRPTECGSVVAGEDVAIGLRQVGVVITQVKLDRLIADGETYVPGPVIRQFYSTGKGRHSVES